ncbi:uncharacterized protein LY89DRAFT_666683 [Mollisia scopiformis]|uniref:Uncharacterized protein n=1 Tax=Mollisia scopiformis TaxID=149040 RepID=A0A194XI80_MOLSC|nr:uncharacterized protein LY89DRAFT_666683 [Mollisia scopiformis]KUJ19834.1 hypothetical protein LY89DRAFT_666683 [Mollisia scopiformis]
MASPIAALPGFPFFYAIPIDGQIREIPSDSQPQIWPEELIDFPEDYHYTLLQLNPPPYHSKPLPPRPKQSLPLALRMPELDETANLKNPSYLPIIVPDDDVITPQTVRARTEPVISKSKTQRRKIRYPSLPIGRWAQPASGNDGHSKDINEYAKTIPQDSVIIHKRKLRFPSIANRPSWSSFRASSPSPLSASASASTSTFLGFTKATEMPPELEAIETVSPLSPFMELDSTPISELSSENSSPQSSPSLPEEKSVSVFQVQFSSPQAPSELDTHVPSTPMLPNRSPYRSWYHDDDAGELSVLSVLSMPPLTEDNDDPPPPHSADCSPPPHEEAASAPGSPSSFLDLDTDDSNNTSTRSSRSQIPKQPETKELGTDVKDPKDFEGDVKENVPDLASLPARPQSFLLMTEEEVSQAEIIEDIFIMLHDLQPNYLHPAHRPQPNVVRMSMMRRFATQIAHVEQVREKNEKEEKEKDEKDSNQEKK